MSRSATTTSPKPDSSELQLGTLLVISGPSGVGKNAVWDAVQSRLPSFKRATTCTTREQRPHEVEGVDYFFVSEAEFDELIDQDQMLEWAQVHNARYGVPASSVLKRLTVGKDVVCVIDVQGAFRLRSLFPTALLVFIKPPQDDPEVLKQRLKQRGNISEEELIVRLKTAEWELQQTQKYDYEIVNDSLESCADKLYSILTEGKKD